MRIICPLEMAYPGETISQTGPFRVRPCARAPCGLRATLANSSRCFAQSRIWGMLHASSACAPGLRCAARARGLRATLGNAQRISSAPRMGPFSASLRCRSGTSLRRTPCGLRATLGNAQRISSAPRPAGSNPWDGGAKEKPPNLKALELKGGPSGMSPAGFAARGRCAARARGLRAPVGNGPRRFLTSAPCGFESMKGRRKRKAFKLEGSRLKWWTVRDSNPGPWD